MVTWNMIVGLVGSGKTTYAYKMAQPHDVVLDSDNVRLALYHDATDQTHNEEVFRQMRNSSVSALSEGKNVFYVATNLNSNRRRLIVEYLKKRFPDVHFKCTIIATPIHECKERNARRERVVPEYVIDRQVKGFQVPYAGEGWDDIEVVSNRSGNDEWIEDMWADVMAFGDQKNPHHSHTLYWHLLDTIDNIPLPQDYDMKRNANLLVAASLHDIGKTYTQTFDENGIAHYYNHENVSAYLALCMNHPLRVVQLVNYHMLPYHGANSCKKWKNHFNDDTLWNDIMLLHQADEAAK